MSEQLDALKRRAIEVGIHPNKVEEVLAAGVGEVAFGGVPGVTIFVGTMEELISEAQDYESLALSGALDSPEAALECLIYSSTMLDLPLV